MLIDVHVTSLSRSRRQAKADPRPHNADMPCPKCNPSGEDDSPMLPNAGPLHPHHCYPRQIHRPAKARFSKPCNQLLRSNSQAANMTPVEELLTTFVFQRLSNTTHVRMNKAAPPRSGSRAPCLSHLPQDTVARLFLLAPPILQKPPGQIHGLSIAAARVAIQPRLKGGGLGA
jgi:hypothetical protein